MPERVSDERLIRWRDDAGYRGLTRRVEENLKIRDDEKIKLDLIDARQERDALREAVREAERRLKESLSEKPAPPVDGDSDFWKNVTLGKQRALSILREATKGVMGDGD